MYCSHCGKLMESGSLFCAGCGAPVRPATVLGALPRPLMRPREGRFIAGICAGFAVAYSWDVTLVRVITAALLLFSAGTVAVAYFALWIIIPEAPYALPQNAVSQPTNGTVA